ncbi:DUF4870 family protein [Motiliproteus sediminis]|uniref:DUF4870 family protein n=1 Tax=Motiliproteus sediminis TaxID=1468178 RepID=UPI001FE579C3|nr:hypothetical protein [Motiliproteus sediminis]
MTDSAAATAVAETNTNPVTVDTGSAKIIYFLYFAGLIFGITALAGLIMAYVNKSDADPVAATHYRFQIRTFWIGLLMLFIGGLTSLILVGYLIILFWVVWVCVRCAKGLKALGKGEPIASPGSWMFG